MNAGASTGADAGHQQAGSPGGAAQEGPPLLELVSVSKHYRRSGLWSGSGAAVMAVSEVSLAVPAGSSVGIVGESGCGKSTLGRLVVGLEKPTGGDVRLRGKPVAAMGRGERRAARYEIQMMFQDPYAALNPRMTVELPGGQRQRVGLARALATSPALIVADEPVSALDVSVRAQILNLMTDLQAEHHIGYLMVSHDLTVIHYFTDFVVVMYLGKFVESGPPEQLFRAPAHHYTRALIDAAPDPVPGRAAAPTIRGELPSAAAPPSGCRFRTRCPAAQAKCAEEEPAMRPFGPGHQAACHFPLKEQKPA
jgi:peptide/nickel transport system ATP-binding protein